MEILVLRPFEGKAFSFMGGRSEMSALSGNVIWPVAGRKDNN